MKTRAEIEAKVQVIIVDHLNVNPADVTQEKTLDDLGADSLDKVELVMVAEEEFEIAISDELAETISTVGDISTVVEKCLGK